MKLQGYFVLVYWSYTGTFGTLYAGDQPLRVNMHAVELVNSGLAVQTPRIAEEIRQYDLDRNYEHLVKAYANLKAIDSLTNELVTVINDIKTNPEVLVKVFDLRLTVYDRCLGARDRNYDFHDPSNAFGTTVSPPFVEGENLIAGMNPAEIMNPEARRKYEQDILANSLKKEKHRRESTMIKMAASLNLEITNAIKTLKDYGTSDTIQHALECVNKRMTDLESKESLLKAIKAQKDVSR